MHGGADDSDGNSYRDYTDDRSGDRQRGIGAGAARGTRIIRPLHQIYAGAQHPGRGRPGGSAIQFQRKAAGTNAAASGAVREARSTGADTPESFSGDAGEHDRNDAFAGEFFYEQVQEDGIYRVQREDQGE